MREKTRRVFGLFAFIFLFWGCYRLIFRFPEIVEELALKPIIWLGPTFYLVLKVEKKKLSSLGFTSNNLFRSLYSGIGLGMIFALAAVFSNIQKYGYLNFSSFNQSNQSFLFSFFLSFATAISEETVFRGYLFSRLREVLKNDSQSNLITGIMFVLIHLPISVFVLHYSLFQILAYFLLLFLFSFGSSLLFVSSGNIISSILAHVFWSWSVILFN